MTDDGRQENRYCTFKVRSLLNRRLVVSLRLSTVQPWENRVDGRVTVLPLPFPAHEWQWLWMRVLGECVDVFWGCSLELCPWIPVRHSVARVENEVYSQD